MVFNLPDWQSHHFGMGFLGVIRFDLHDFLWLSLIFLFFLICKHRTEKKIASILFLFQILLIAVGCGLDIVDWQVYRHNVDYNLTMMSFVTGLSTGAIDSSHERSLGIHLDALAFGVIEALCVIFIAYACKESARMVGIVTFMLSLMVFNHAMVAGFSLMGNDLNLIYDINRIVLWWLTIVILFVGSDRVWTAITRYFDRKTIPYKVVSILDAVGNFYYRLLHKP